MLDRCEPIKLQPWLECEGKIRSPQFSSSGSSHSVGKSWLWGSGLMLSNSVRQMCIDENLDLPAWLLKRRWASWLRSCCTPSLLSCFHCGWKLYEWMQAEGGRLRGVRSLDQTKVVHSCEALQWGWRVMNRYSKVDSICMSSKRGWEAWDCVCISAWAFPRWPRAWWRCVVVKSCRFISECPVKPFLISIVSSHGIWAETSAIKMCLREFAQAVELLEEWSDWYDISESNDTNYDNDDDHPEIVKTKFTECIKRELNRE